MSLSVNLNFGLRYSAGLSKLNARDLPTPQTLQFCAENGSSREWKLLLIFLKQPRVARGTGYQCYQRSRLLLSSVGTTRSMSADQSHDVKFSDMVEDSTWYRDKCPNP